MALNCTCTLSPIFFYGVHVGEFDKVPCARIVWLCIFGFSSSSWRNRMAGLPPNPMPKGVDKSLHNCAKPHSD
jgi:hypothetical protein